MNIKMNYCSKCGTKLRIVKIPNSEESVYHCKKCKVYLPTRLPERKEIKLELSEITRLKIIIRSQYYKGSISQTDYDKSRNIVNKIIRFVKNVKGIRR